MLKQRPKQFWGLLKGTANQEIDIPLKEFATYNEHMFWDASITQDEFTPLANSKANYITEEEMKDVLQHHFKANKSSGLSRMPL